MVVIKRLQLTQYKFEPYIAISAVSSAIDWSICHPCICVVLHMPFVSRASVFCRVRFSNSLYFTSMLQTLYLSFLHLIASSFSLSFDRLLIVIVYVEIYQPTRVTECSSVNWKCSVLSDCHAMRIVWIFPSALVCYCAVNKLCRVYSL